MVRVLPTVMAVVAVGMMAVGLLGMTIGNLRAAGMSFLSASLIIYLRERRFGSRSGADTDGENGSDAAETDA